MNALTRTLLLTFALVGALAAPAADRVFVAVDYMHIPERSSDDQYIALEKLWQRLHQKMVDAGTCRAWYLNRVENGGRYQFVTIRVYDSLEKLASPWNAALMEGLYNKEEQAIMEKTDQIRDFAHTELWEIEASALKAGAEVVPAMVQMDFMKAKPGKAGAYYEAEKKMWQKIHQAHVNAGKMLGWHFLSRFYPAGSDSEYDFITANAFGKEGRQFDMKIAQSALTKEEGEKMTDPTELRALVRQEIWRPLLKTSAPKK